jgi:hypothetical protein
LRILFLEHFDALVHLGQLLPCLVLDRKADVKQLGHLPARASQG